MASGSRAATITRFFNPLSKEEVHEKIKKDSAAWQEEERNRVAWNEAAKAAKESARLAAKWPVGRPKRVRAQVVMVPPNMGAEKQGDAVGASNAGWSTHNNEQVNPSAKKQRGSYTNWFVQDLWPHIEAVVRQHPKSLYDALFSLQHIRKPGRIGSPFDKLTMNTMKGWFERDVQSGHFKLLKKYEEGVAAQKARVQKGKSESREIFKDHPQAFDTILSTLKGMWDVGQPMDANVAQTVILGIVQALVPELLLKRTGKGGKLFQVSKRFSRKFLNRYLGWTWKKATTAASKLPEDWEQQGDEMAFRVAVLCKTKGIPPELVCNSDQTAVHLCPSTEQMYEVKGVKEVKCLGKDDKLAPLQVGSLCHCSWCSRGRWK
jgi:hypothetical protein